MKNRIPPPLLTLLLAILMLVFAVKFDGYAFQLDLRFWIGLTVLVMGFAAMLSAGLGFRREKTTVNPFRPERTSNIVQSGIYKFTRNPMYLGMAAILAGTQITLGYGHGVFLILGFVLYMTQYQIKPEEQALTAKFGQDYLNYMQRVRRWI